MNAVELLTALLIGTGLTFLAVGVLPLIAMLIVRLLG
jgi:hypothetical protein